MTAHAVIAQVANQRAEAMNVKLKNQREADQDGVNRLSRSQYLCCVVLKVEYNNFITMETKRGREITKTEVFLILKTNQDNRTQCIAHTPGSEFNVANNLERNG